VTAVSTDKGASAAVVDARRVGEAGSSALTEATPVAEWGGVGHEPPASGFHGASGGSRFRYFYRADGESVANCGLPVTDGVESGAVIRSLGDSHAARAEPPAPAGGRTR
jgi:hypothetical protein